MAIENAKTLNVRIRNKYDTYENWIASSLVLEAGEIAIAHTTVDVKVDNGTAKHPALLMKVGNGTDTFDKLPWMSAKAADVIAAAKSEEALTTFVNNVIADAGIATNDALVAIAGRVTTAEGEIDALQADLDTAETGLKARVTTAEGAITALKGLVGDESVADQINGAIEALNLADTYAAKVHGHEIADVNGLADSIAAAKKAGTDANAALEAYKTLNDAAVKVNTDAIAGIKNGEVLDNFKEVEEALAAKQAAGDYSVVGHKHEIADVNGLSDAIADAKQAGTDAAGAAAQALTDAKAYTDSEMARLVGDETVATQITEALADYTTTTDMNTAIGNAKGEAIGHADDLDEAMNTRVEALEAIDHDHGNKGVLDGITAEKVAAWDIAEQNAKDHADDLDKAMDLRVQALEAKFGEGEGNVADQIADAVAAEANLREEADAALQEQITANDGDIAALKTLVGDTNVAEAIETAVTAEKERAEAIEADLEERLAAVEGNYATDADVEGLQTQINTIMNNPDAEGAINSINEFTQYVLEHGAIADGFRADINKNKEDIAAEAERAAGVEADLEERLAAVEADYLTSADKTELQGNIDAKAAQTDLDKAVEDITALKGLVGEDSVAVQIETALEGALMVDGAEKYALAADLEATNQEVAKKANDEDLAAIAKSGSTDDLVQGDLVLVFDCGGATE